MPLQSFSKISLFSSRQDVIYLCKKAVEQKYEVSLADDFSQIRLLSSPVLLFDSRFLLDNRDFLFYPDEKLAQKCICLLDPDIPSSIMSIIEENFAYTLSYPPDRQILCNLIEVVYSRQNNYVSPFKSPDKISTKIPSHVKGLFTGNSTIMQNLRRDINSAILCNNPVLILGETGVGKTTAAQLIHDLSNRGLYDMQFINMATLVDGLAESTLFGTKAGGFTDATNRDGLFKMAHRSTLFLDEIGTASTSIQSKLLTVLETGLIKKVGSDAKEKVDVRIITATNANIYNMLNDGSFRRDLYFRISDILIEIPPLREHKEDIKNIALDFIKDKGNYTFDDAAIEKLKSYDWPGNIRELHQCIKRAISKCIDGVITPEIIDFGLFNKVTLQ